MHIFPNEWGQVYRLRTGEFCLKGKWLGDEVELKILETDNTLHSHTNAKAPCCKHSAPAPADIQRIGKRRYGHGSGLVKFQRDGAFLALQMQRVAFGDLVEMRFHEKILAAHRQRVNRVPCAAILKPCLDDSENIGIW